MTIQRVLSIDDLGETIASVRGALKANNIKVDEAPSVAVAREFVGATKYDFILCDARLPDDDGKLDFHAGPRFLESLRKGQFGALNRMTRCLILTSFPFQVHSQRISLENFAGVVTKASVDIGTLGIILGIDLDLGDWQYPGEALLMDLLICEAQFDPSATVVDFLVPAWEGDGLVSVDIDELPDDVKFAYTELPRPWYVWAQVNVLAENASTVQPRDFQVFLGGEDS